MPAHVLSTLNHTFLFSAELNLPDAFSGILEDMNKQKEAWMAWAGGETPQTDPLPGEWNSKLNHFKKLIVLKAFRPEKLSAAFLDFVLQHMGKFYTEPPSVTMEIVYADTDQTTPMIFILSTGADPTSQLIKFAKVKGQNEDMVAISLG